MGKKGFQTKGSVYNTIKKDFLQNKYVYLLALPVVIWYVIFCYLPIYGSIIAFKNYSPGLGIIRSEWVGFDNFIQFFKGIYATRVIRNTLIINFYSLVFAFPAPIILALLLNEIKNRIFKRTMQSISYLPHFVSIMVVCGLIIDFTSRNGVINKIIQLFGGKPANLLFNPDLFRGIYISSGIWQEIGWSSIIYLAAIASIDAQQYEAAIIDGAGRFRRLLHITLPGMMPIIIILFILRVGQMMDIGYEKIILLYNPNTYETADVISSYIFRRGLLQSDFSFSAAVGLMNSVVNLILLGSTNWMSNKLSKTSLW